MPEPVKRGQRYIPGLDGLRAIAVLAVLAYHLGFAWAPGGLLGVGVFFTLSGYLITDLLLAQVARGGIRLKSFWLARARRLLPGLVVMLIVVMAWVTVIGPHQAPDFRTAAATGLFYVNNWWLIFHNVSYFAQFAAPSPLNHLWSLSIEEQFYIVWPFLLLLGVRLVPEFAPAGVRPRLASDNPGARPCLGAVDGDSLPPGNRSVARLLRNRHTRSGDPHRRCLGHGLAKPPTQPQRHGRRTPSNRRRRSSRARRDRPDVLALGGVLELPVPRRIPGAVGGNGSRHRRVDASGHPAWARGRMPAHAMDRRAVIRHLPLALPDHRPHDSGGGAQRRDPVRAFFQVVAIIGIAALSWKYVEDPIRHGALARLWAQARAGGWRRHRVTPLRRAAFAGISLVFIAAVAGMAGVGDDPSKANQVGQLTVDKTVTAGDVASRSKTDPCSSVVHIGDSTSEGLVSADYLPNPKQRITAQYRRIGAKTQHLEISGARSIYETYEGDPERLRRGSGAGRTAASMAAGCWRSAPTRRRTSPRARTTGSISGSTG